MKKIAYTAVYIAVASITFISCKWFSKQPRQVFQGQWKIDSIYYAGTDTNSIAPLLIALAKREKSTDSLTIRFITDSTCTHTDIVQKNESKYHYTKDSIYIQELDKSTAFHYQFINDSSLQFKTSDSTVLLLSKVH